MRIGVVGVNHKSSDLQLRERISKAATQLFSSDTEYKERLSLILITTCNRTEIYFNSLDLAEAHREILSLLREKIKEAFEHALYSYFGEDCFTHLALVTAGIDSVILGESEIQRQVKLSYENATLNSKLAKEIHYVFQKSFKVAKGIRTFYPTLRSQVSLEGMIFQLTRSFFPHLSSLKVLFVGNSKINRKLISYFKRKGLFHLSLCTRSLLSAKKFATEEGIDVYDWNELFSWHKYDFVIAGTKSADFVIKGEDLPKNYSTKLIMDLGVPRNVDPRFRIHPYITLLNIEEIGNLIKEKEKDIIETIEDVEIAARNNVLKLLQHFQEKEISSCAC